MSLQDVVLPKEYQNTKVLFEQNLDAWRISSEQGFFVSNLNLTQIARDCFVAGYEYDNDGLANYSISLEQRINNIASGATPLAGTSSDTFTINTDGNSATLSTVLLNTNRTYFFPDVGGTFVLLDATQTLTNKTLTAPIINGGILDAVTFTNCPQLLPIGGVIPFYDFNGLATFNATYWTYCNGGIIGGAGPLVGQTLPDQSGRALVGFGTDGGGDIGTAPWATAAVGNAGNTINLQHAHTDAGHTHDMGNHTHTGPSHTHNVSAHTHSIASDGDHDHGARTNGMSLTANETSPNYRLRDDSAGWVSRVSNSYHIAVQSGANDEGEHDHDISVDGAHDHGAVTGSASPATGASGTGATGVPSTNNTSSTSVTLSNSLSTTQSIQPISIRYRFIMRIL